ncbi:MAG: hypothetical protein WC846_04650 [Candidatus Gracilibacteria bacterium]
MRNYLRPAFLLISMALPKVAEAHGGEEILDAVDAHRIAMANQKAQEIEDMRNQVREVACVGNALPEVTEMAPLDLPFSATEKGTMANSMRNIADRLHDAEVETVPVAPSVRAGNMFERAAVLETVDYRVDTQGRVWKKAYYGVTVGDEDVLPETFLIGELRGNSSDTFIVAPVPPENPLQVFEWLQLGDKGFVGYGPHTDSSGNCKVSSPKLKYSDPIGSAIFSDYPLGGSSIKHDIVNLSQDNHGSDSYGLNMGDQSLAGVPLTAYCSDVLRKMKDLRSLAPDLGESSKYKCDVGLQPVAWKNVRTDAPLVKEDKTSCETLYTVILRCEQKSEEGKAVGKNPAVPSMDLPTSEPGDLRDQVIIKHFDHVLRDLNSAKPLPTTEISDIILPGNMPRALKNRVSKAVGHRDVMSQGEYTFLRIKNRATGNICGGWKENNSGEENSLFVINTAQLATVWFSTGKDHVECRLAGKSGALDAGGADCFIGGTPYPGIPASTGSILFTTALDWCRGDSFNGHFEDSSK